MVDGSVLLLAKFWILVLSANASISLSLNSVRKIQVSKFGLYCDDLYIEDIDIILRKKTVVPWEQTSNANYVKLVN